MYAAPVSLDSPTFPRRARARVVALVITSFSEVLIRCSSVVKGAFYADQASISLVDLYRRVNKLLREQPRKQDTGARKPEIKNRITALFRPHGSKKKTEKPNS
jgi:hypothetical protein